MSKKDYAIGVGALGNVYLGRLNKAGTMWVGDKKDITSQFINCVIHKFGPNGCTEITDGKGNITHRVVVVAADRKIAINDKVVFEPEIEEFSLDIRKVGFSVRTVNGLLSKEIKTLGQLLEYTPKELKTARNFGDKSLEEVIQVLAKRNLKLKS